MRTTVGRQCHEDNILLAAFSYFTAGSCTPRVSKQNYFQKYPWVIGRGSIFIIAESAVKDGEIKLFIDKLVQGELEGTGEDLFREHDRDKLSLGI